MKVKQDKIRDIIGQGGKTIRGIQSDCGVKISVEDTGIVTIASSDEASLQKAKDIIDRLTEEVEVGKVYTGTVRKIMDFGAFVEVLARNRWVGPHLSTGASPCESGVRRSLRRGPNSCEGSGNR